MQVLWGVQLLEIYWYMPITKLFLPKLKLYIFYFCLFIKAWGVTNISFIDYGKVSYSNPVRQSLFNYEDALNGGKDKAETAAKQLLCICPGLVRLYA